MSSKRGASLGSESGPVTEPFFSRLVLAPLLFVSFLVSLFLIDKRAYGSIFGRSGSKDGYYHSHQRKLAKREMDDAFQLRGKVIAAMCLLSAMLLALAVWAVDSVWRIWTGRV